MKYLIILLLSLLSSAAMAQDPASPEASNEKNYVYKDTVTFSADGHKMVTQMYIPEGEGPWPVVVYRTPYHNFPARDVFASYRKYAENGMVFLIQRCRGTGGSEGTYEPNVYERGDGKALLDWLQEAPWCSSIAFRDDKLGSRQTYTPGDVVEVTVEMLPIIWEIQPGSRIRIDISSSDFPQYSVHSNYPGVWSEQTRTRIATQTVHTGRKYPTRVIIPVL